MMEKNLVLFLHWIKRLKNKVFVMSYREMKKCVVYFFHLMKKIPFEAVMLFLHEIKKLVNTVGVLFLQWMRKLVN